MAIKKFKWRREVETTTCSSTVVSGPSYNYTQTTLGSTSLPPFYLSSTYDYSVVRICDGDPLNETCVYYAINCTTTTTFISDIVNQINWNGDVDNVHKVIYNGITVFTKDLPRLSISSVSYNSTSDRLSVSYSVSET